MLRTASGGFCSHCGCINAVGWLKVTRTLQAPSSHRSASTRPLQSHVDENTLPRFLRRKLLREASRNTSPSKSVSNEKGATATPVFRSRHYDSSKVTTPKSELRLLEPHVLSARLKKLSDSGKLDDAVFMLKNAPLDAQNTPVWNTMIWESMKAQRYSLAYKLYVDVRHAALFFLCCSTHLYSLDEAKGIFSYHPYFSNDV